MQRVVEIVRMADYCPSCHSKYTIELYDVYGNQLGLTRLLNRNMLEETIETKKLASMKCKKCKTEYKILYTQDGNIMPLNEMIDPNYYKFKSDLNKKKGNLYGK